jgi:hypothetical protein
MKSILLFLFMAITLAAYSQSTNLSTVNTVKPNKGQKMAFETNYKVHVAKFHKDDQKTSVYEIMSGEMAGYYHLVNAGRSYANFDKERPDAAAHNMDLDKTFFPLLEDTKNATFRYMDSLSIRSDVEADKFVVTVRHINPALEADYRTELAIGIKILKNVKGKFWENLSYSNWEQLWDGTDPVVVNIRGLKDGFQSLDTDFYGPAGSGFRDEYVKAYGTAAWDKRTKLNTDAIVKSEQYIMRLRKDLSSQ